MNAVKTPIIRPATTAAVLLTALAGGGALSAAGRVVWRRSQDAR